MDPHLRLRPNVPDVAAKVIDGEAVIIRFSDGLYFALGGPGSLVWELIEQRRTPAEIVAAVAAGYDAPEARIREDLTGLVEELVRERLVTTTAEGPAAGGPAARAGRQPYDRPVLQRYQDMADLLALDPSAPGMADGVWRPAPGSE